MSPIFIIMVIYALPCYCDWSLKWHDEFNGSELDKTKWRVTDGKDILEAPDNEVVLSYSTDNKTNIQLIDGVLAITAVQESIGGRSFTTATINSRLNFLYGRVDLRAALPKGNLLKTAIFLFPEKLEYGRGRVNGEIVIVTDIQRDMYYTRATYHGNFNAMKTYPTLDDFQEYSIEWNETQITWSLNGTVRRTFDLDKIFDPSFYQKKGQPFDKKFYLAIRLQVSKFQTDELVIYENYHANWSCPALLVDYVRIYQQDNSVNTSNTLEYPGSLEGTSKLKKDICKTVNKSLSLFYDQGHSTLKLYLIIVIPFTILIIILALGSYFYQKRKQNDDQGPGEYTNYMDVNNEERKTQNYEYNDVIVDNRYVTEQDRTDPSNQPDYLEMKPGLRN